MNKKAENLFVNTIILTITALIVISTLYAGEGQLITGGATPLEAGAALGIDKTNMAQLAFASIFGNSVGNIFIAVCMFFFAFSTILGWNLFGKINVEYLFGKKATIVYSVLALVFIFLGSCLKNDIVWELADTFNQLMVIPNVIALFALSGIVSTVIKNNKK